MHKEGALFPLATARHKYEIDMCTGSLPQKILLFSLPLMATGMLQLLFNAADIIVVGRYVGSHALAAVGSNGSIINLIVNLFMGISIGGSAVIPSTTAPPSTRVSPKPPTPACWWDSSAVSLSW